LQSAGMTQSTGTLQWGVGYAVKSREREPPETLELDPASVGAWGGTQPYGGGRQLRGAETKKKERMHNHGANGKKRRTLAMIEERAEAIFRKGEERIAERACMQKIVGSCSPDKETGVQRGMGEYPESGKKKFNQSGEIPVKRAGRGLQHIGETAPKKRRKILGGRPSQWRAEGDACFPVKTKYVKRTRSRAKGRDKSAWTKNKTRSAQWDT